MKKKIYLPRSAEELKKLNHQKQAELWTRYNNSPYERQFRALWHYIACENANIKIERKHLAGNIRLSSRKLMILSTTDSIIKPYPP